MCVALLPVALVPLWQLEQVAVKVLCPEHSILGIIDGKAALLAPAMCVGHGACQAACPTKAISLVSSVNVI